MAKAIVIYYSITGNTKEMAEIIAGAMNEAGLSTECKSVDKVKAEDLLDFDAIVVGSPTYYGHMAAPVKQLFDDSVANHGRLDGKVAAGTNRTSLFGAIFDSTLDRYSEFFMYIGLAAYFRNHWALWVAILAFLGSAMVSYTRARAEGLGIDCKIGIMQRAERLILLCLGSIIGSLAKIFDPVMIAVLGVIALISNFTALQRTFYVKKIENQMNQKKED